MLGAVESGVDFEKRIAAIYQQCRTPEQIQFEFDQLQRELETEIAAGQRDAREKLLDNFDQEVVEKVRIQSHDVLDRFNEQLWQLTRHVLARLRRLRRRSGYSFMLHTNPFPGETIHPGPYRMGKASRTPTRTASGIRWRSASWRAARRSTPPPREVTFDYTGSGKNIAVLEPLVGRAGWLACARLTRQRAGDGGSLALRRRDRRRRGRWTRRSAAGCSICRPTGRQIDRVPDGVARGARRGHGAPQGAARGD